jgi:signal peptidase
MFQALSLAVLIFLVGGALLMVGTRPFGLTPYVILSGSKEPSFPAGSIVYVKQIEPEQVRVGDAITFVLNEALEIATNRVVSIDEGGPYFYTVGDEEDSTFVYFKNLLGIPQFSIPKLGYLAHAIASSPGNFIAMGSTVIFVFISYVLEVTDPKKKKKNEVKDKPLPEQEQEDDSTSQLMGITAN